MQVEVVSASVDAIVLGAPLEPNINHRETVFGGSASALAILSAWSLLHTRLQAEQVTCQLVIQRNVMEYNLPIDGAFHAKATIACPEDWPRFLLMLSRKGRARITVSAVLEFNGSPAGRFSGEFVALRR
jgi:thioesterase domain-containing protein